ncbi:MAG: diguanylate cyclase, partial [Bdellovibrio sp.]
MEIQSQDCVSLSKEKPEWASLIKKCDLTSLCDQIKKQMADTTACLRGYRNAAVDMLTGVKDVAVSLGGLVDEAWEGFKKNTKTRDLFIKECNSSLVCKRDLVKEDPRYNKLSDRELEKISAAFLYTQSLDMKATRSSLQRSEVRMASANLPGRETPSTLDPEQQWKLSVLMKAAKEGLSRQYSRYQCYVPNAQDELACYAMGGVLDPISVAGYFAKGTRLSAALGRKVEELLQERRLTQARKVASAELLGKRLRTVSLPNMPESMALAEYMTVDGSKYLAFEKTVTLRSGKIVKEVQEVGVDSLTGAYDARYAGGRDFMETLLKEKGDQVGFVFIDVNNLKYINDNFARGSEAGDRYLKAVTDAVREATEGKAEIFKLGGDELGVVIHESDPVKLKALSEKIIKTVYGGNTHQLFREEKILKAQQFRGGEVTREELKEFASYSKEGISLGVTQVGRNEDIGAVLNRVEGQAEKMKIRTKEAMNIDTIKYGGKARDPGKVPDQRYVPALTKVIPKSSSTTSYMPLSSLARATSTLEIVREKELYRFGPMAVAQYKDEMGRESLRYEKYIHEKSGKTQVVSRELVINDNTQIIDGTHEGGQELMKQFREKAMKNEDRAFLSVDAENLGKINYFDKKSQAGNEYLKAVSDVIKREVAKDDIPIKMQGGKLVITAPNLNPG